MNVESLFGWTDGDRDKSSLELLAADCEILQTFRRRTWLKTYMEGFLLGVETAPLNGPVAFCDWLDAFDMM